MTAGKTTALLIRDNGTLRCTLIDTEDIGIAKGRAWSVTTGGYLRSNHSKVALHRVIAKAEKGMLVDHINRDTFDNRKSNLRLCTVGENCRNARKRNFKKRVMSSVFTGVSKNGGLGKPWIAQIQVDKKKRWIGSFDSEESAARAYDKVAIELHGPFASLNFPVQ